MGSIDPLSATIDRLNDTLFPRIEFLQDYQKLLEDEIDVLLARIAVLDSELAACRQCIEVEDAGA